MSKIEADHLFNHLNSTTKDIPTGIFNNYISDDIIKSMNIKVAKSNISNPIDFNKKIYIGKNKDGNFYGFTATKKADGKYQANQFLNKSAFIKTSKIKDIEYQIIDDDLKTKAGAKKEPVIKNNNQLEKKKTRSKSRSVSKEKKPRSKSRSASKEKKPRSKSSSKDKKMKNNVTFKAGAVTGIDSLPANYIKELAELVIKDKMNK